MKLDEVFVHPWVLLIAVVLVPLVWRAWLNPRRRAAIRFSSIEELEQFGSRSWSARARVIIPILRSIAIIMLVVAVARPRKADEMTRIKTEGVALELVIDRSGSMDEPDFRDQNGRPQTRLQVVKDVVQAFIKGDGGKLPGRPDDLIGLTVFARYPDTICPLTWDHDHIVRSLREVRPAVTREEGGTAIGDALLLGVERVRNIARRMSKKDDFKLTSRAVILLTDGEQNAGRHGPEEAAKAAAALGIKIYTIGVVPPPEQVRFGRTLMAQQSAGIGEELLQFVANTTRAQYFRATDAASLQNIYAEIDRLERSEVDEKRYYLYEELAYRWIDLGGIRLPPPLLVALVALGLEQLLVSTRFRRIP